MSLLANLPERASAVSDRGIEGLPRKSRLTHYPQNLSELQTCLTQITGDFQVVSTGCNWGLGAKYCESGVLIDLSQWRSFSWDEDRGILQISPGVTQQQIAQHLQEIGSKYFLDVTGSASFSSLMGNVLQRGISYHQQRCDMLISLRALDRRGRELMWDFADDPAAEINSLYAHNLGPDLKALCLQSEWVVVYAMTLKLNLRPHAAISAKIKIADDRSLLDLLDRLQPLIERKVVTGIPHIANHRRTLSSIQPWLSHCLQQQQFSMHKRLKSFCDLVVGRSQWNLLCYLADDFGALSRKQRILRKALPGYSLLWLGDGLFRLLERLIRWWPRNAYLHVLLALRSFHGLAHGRPTNAALGSIATDIAIAADALTFESSLQNSQEGFLYFLPVFPYRRECSEKLLSATAEWQEAWHYELAITINPLNALVLEAVISFNFPKAQSERAHQAYHDLKSRLAVCGAYPYRLANFDPDLKQRLSQQRRLLAQIVETF